MGSNKFFAAPSNNKKVFLSASKTAWALPKCLISFLPMVEPTPGIWVNAKANFNSSKIKFKPLLD